LGDVGGRRRHHKREGKNVVMRAGGSGGNIWLWMAVMAGASNLLSISEGMRWSGEGRWVVWTTMMTTSLAEDGDGESRWRLINTLAGRSYVIARGANAPLSK
jgi:hypothetical protein